MLLIRLFTIVIKEKPYENGVSQAIKNTKVAVIQGTVHTYPEGFEYAAFSLWIRLTSTRIRRIRQRIFLLRVRDEEML